MSEDGAIRIFNYRELVGEPCIQQLVIKTANHLNDVALPGFLVLGLVSLGRFRDAILANKRAVGRPHQVVSLFSIIEIRGSVIVLEKRSGLVV